jgi:uncharacterized protein YjdB
VVIDGERDSIAYGTEKQFTARVIDQFNRPGLAPIAWSSTNSEVVSVSSAGRASAIGAGSAALVAAIPGHADTVQVTVFGVITSLQVVPEVVSVPEGDTLQFEAAFGQEQGSPNLVRWASTDTAVARVDATGILTAQGEGEMELTASYGRTEARAAVRVYKLPVHSISIRPAAATVAPGAAVTLTAELRDILRRTLEDREVNWSSSNTDVARVNDDGVVTGVVKGYTIITARSENRRATAMVTVGPRPVSTVAVELESADVVAGQRVQATAVVNDASGTVIPTTEQPVAWQSSNPSIATVTSAGTVTGIAEGDVTVSAISGGRTGSKRLAVRKRLAQRVAISPTNPSVAQGASVTLDAKVVDQTGAPIDGGPITWSSSAPSVATISATGVATGMSGGNATITARSGTLSGTAALTVAAAPVASVSIAPGSAALNIGGTVALTATAKDANGQALPGRVMAWSSSNPVVASVSNQGVVTAIATGSATITATSEGKSATAQVNVNSPAPVPVQSVVVALNASTLDVSQTTQAAATLFDAQGRVLTGRVVAWSTADDEIATVSPAGVVTAVATGTVTITATSEGKSGAATLTVNPSAPAPVASVGISISPASIGANQTAQATVVLKDAAGNVLTGRSIAYKSSNTGVATVSATGVVTGKSAGSASITATSNNKSASATITVTTGSSTAPVADAVVSAPKSIIAPGESVQLTVVARDAQGNVLTRPVVWSSESPGVATVDQNGKVTGVAAGSTNIWADVNQQKEAKLGITVQSAGSPLTPVNTVLVSLNASSLNVGQTTQAQVTLKDLAGALLTNRTISFTSSNVAVATVSPSGVVTAVAAGTAQISATSEGKSGSASLTVTAPSSPPPQTPPPVPTDTGAVAALLGQYLSSSQVSALGGAFARYESDFVGYDDAQWNQYSSQSDAWGWLNYYDRVATYYVWWRRTGNTKYLSRGHQLALNYRKNYLEAAGYGASPHWSQLDGITLHYLLTGDEASRTAVGLTAEKLYRGHHLALGTLGTAAPEWMDTRIQARVLLSYFLAWRINAPGAPTGSWGSILEEGITRVLQNQQADGSWRWVQTCNESLNYMSAMLNDVLIRVYQGYRQDARIRTAVEKSANFLWTQWIAGSSAFKYLSGTSNCTSPGGLGVGGPVPAPDLNGMFVTTFGWMYRQTGDATWRTRGDAVLAGGVNAAYLTGAKQFNEHYGGSYRYMAWR